MELLLKHGASLQAVTEVWEKYEDWMFIDNLCDMILSTKNKFNLQSFSVYAWET